ncbi:unnamed protein product [Adineta ricciae]|uniref:Uncharacterized protein n=1 Tax=Adineta ricciae TaxID=249248 RepID=A0A815GEH4_ADIRI|nr:unnamed protein product [Adineta ricciae]
MLTTDPQLLHVPQQSANRKRNFTADNHVSVSRAHSPSSKKSVLISRRRHSTPQVSTLRFVELKSPQSHPFVKQYYVNARTTRTMHKDPNGKSDLIRSPPRPATLVKPRYPDERTARLLPIPTSLCLNNDIFLPVAKKNRSTIVETPSPATCDLQTINYSEVSKKRWNKREKAFSVDLDSDVFRSNEESIMDYVSLAFRL